MSIKHKIQTRLTCNFVRARQLVNRNHGKPGPRQLRPRSQICRSQISCDDFHHSKCILTIDNHCDGPYLIVKLRQRGNHKLANDIYQLLLKQGGNRSGIGFGDVDNLGNVHADQFSWDYSWGNVKQKTFRMTKKWTLRRCQRPMRVRCRCPIRPR